MTAPHIILLPGMLCDDDYWADQRDALDRVATISIASYPLLESFAEMAMAVLRDAPARFAVAGHSMGGRVAQEILRQAPERISGICLCGTDSKGIADEATRRKEEAAYHAMLDHVAQTGFAQFTENWAKRVVAPDRQNDKHLTDRIIGMAERCGAASLKAHLAAALSRPDYDAVLSRANIPALLIAGEVDTDRPAERHSAMAQLMPDARFAIIEGAGHMMSMENPTAVNAQMLSWIARLNN